MKKYLSVLIPAMGCACHGWPMPAKLRGWNVFGGCMPPKSHGWRMCLGAILCLLLVGPWFVPAVKAAGGLFDILESISGAGDEKEPKFRVSYVEGDREADDEILLIKIHGIIKESDDSDRMPFELKKDLIENLKKDLECAKERAAIKAVLIDIDSPGGGVTASDLIHHMITKFKGSKKMVFAHIGMLGASGGYYVACAADQIWAQPTSIIGSIGVLMQAANLQKLADLVGYRDVTLKSERTPKKDIMSPFREMTSDEKVLLVGIVDGMYDRFVRIVADGRKKKTEEVVALADGSIYSAEQSLKHGLIDGIGYRDEVMEKIVAAAGLKSARIVKRKIKRGFAEIFAEFSEARSDVPDLTSYLKETIEAADTPKFLFQFKMKKD